jgi:plasmid stabilization system protein ParE
MERYILAPAALQDLQDIWDFVAVDNPAAASALQEEFFRAFEGLAAMPGKGHKRDDLTDSTRSLFPS